MRTEFDKIMDTCSGAFKQSRTAERVLQLAYGLLTCYGRHTVTGMLTACGQQFVDWTSAYKIFSEGRINMDKIFDVSSWSVLEELTPDQMLVAHMDDTIIKKTGKKIPGTAWRRDPLGPPFHTNFIWGQRFLQISMALPDAQRNCQSRAIPVDFHHCPTVKKPKKTAETDELVVFKEQQRIAKLSKQGSLRIHALRERLNQQGAAHRQLFISVDGSYTNETVLKTLPDKVTLIGRIRKDTTLYALPNKAQSTGRKKVYGKQLPSPEQIRQSEDIPWQFLQAWAAGKSHNFKVKVIKDVRWRSAGQQHTLQLVVISPLGYRLKKDSRILYRQAAYLICTDSKLEIEKLLQAYLWRWEIEVNFRDEKTILGCGQAQVRNPESAKNLPAFTTAIYAFMLLAAHRANKNRNESMFPKAKWDSVNEHQRMTSSEMINLLRGQLWMSNDKMSFSGFLKNEHLNKSQKNYSNPIAAALFYVRK
ncbi:MAG: transposase, partial [Bacteroidota bacterium]